MLGSSPSTNGTGRQICTAARPRRAASRPCTAPWPRRAETTLSRDAPAVSIAALRRLDLDRLYRGYGFPNDMLVHLNVQNARVRDVPSRPIYGVGERSGIRIRRVAPRIAWLLFKGFWWRMLQKYVIRDFHPLVFFYALGGLMTVVGLVLGVIVACSRIFWGNEITTATVVLVALLLVSGTQFTLFAMWFDQEANKDLR